MAHHQLDRARGRGRVDLPHTAARLPAELPHGAGRAVGEHFAAGVRGLGAVEIAVGKAFDLEDLAQRGIRDVHAKAAHAAVLEDLRPQLVEKRGVDMELAAKAPVGEGLPLGDGLV